MKKVILLFISLVFMMASVVSAETISDLQSDKNGVDSQLQRIAQEKKKQLEQLKFYSGLASNLDLSEAEQYAQLQEFEECVANSEKEIEKLKQEIISAEEQYAQKLDELKKRIVEAYVNSGINIIDIFSKAGGIAEAYQEIEIRKYMAKYDKNLLEEVSSLREDLEYKRQMAEDLKIQYQTAVANTQVAIHNMETMKSKAEKTAEESKARVSQLKKQEDQLYRESQELLKKIIEMQKKISYAGGEMMWPLPASRKMPKGGSAFGMRLHPIFKEWKMHTGIDIGAPTGTSIIAANSGTVIMSGYTTGYGNRVVIDHGGGICTLYAHASKLLVKSGTKVERGKVIALVGSTGYSTGPHLHFEVIKDGKQIDPMLYVDINR